MDEIERTPEGMGISEAVATLPTHVTLELIGLRAEVAQLREASATGQPAKTGPGECHPLCRGHNELPTTHHPDCRKQAIVDLIACEREIRRIRSAMERAQDQGCCCGTKQNGEGLCGRCVCYAALVDPAAYVMPDYVRGLRIRRTHGRDGPTMP